MSLVLHLRQLLLEQLHFLAQLGFVSALRRRRLRHLLVKVRQMALGSRGSIRCHRCRNFVALHSLLTLHVVLRSDLIRVSHLTAWQSLFKLGNKDELLLGGSKIKRLTRLNY